MSFQQIVNGWLVSLVSYKCDKIIKMDAKEKALRVDQTMDRDGLLSDQHELTPANLKSAGDLIETSMQILRNVPIDQKTGFRTVYTMTSKITGSNFLNRKVDANGSRFYVKISDVKPKDPLLSNQKDGLIVEYKKVGPNLEPIAEGMWTLPRDRRFAEDRYLLSLRDKDKDWSLVAELTNDLKMNAKVYKKAMLIDEATYSKRAR
jgi:hypothetical protein